MKSYPDRVRRLPQGYSDRGDSTRVGVGFGRVQPRHSLSVTVLVLVLVATAFANVIPGGRAILFVALAIVVALPFLWKASYWGHTSVNLAAALLIACLLLSLVVHPVDSAQALYSASLAIACYVIFVCFSAISPSESALRAFVHQASLVARVLLLAGTLYELLDLPYLYGKTGALLLIYFFVAADDRRGWFSKLIFGALLIYQAAAAGDRGVLVAVAFALFGYVLWPLVTRRKMLGRMLLVVFFASLALVPVVYSRLYASEYRELLDSLALEYTGGRFFSGRELLWDTMLQVAMESGPLLGVGFSETPARYGFALSFHSTYVALITWTGLIGLALFLVLFACLLSNYARFAEDSVVRLSAAFAIGILVKQSTEFELVGNSVAFAIPAWFVIAMGAIRINSILRAEALRNPVNDRTVNPSVPRIHT